MTTHHNTENDKEEDTLPPSARNGNKLVNAIIAIILGVGGGLGAAGAHHYGFTQGSAGPDAQLIGEQLRAVHADIESLKAELDSLKAELYSLKDTDSKTRTDFLLRIQRVEIQLETVLKEQDRLSDTRNAGWRTK